MSASTATGPRSSTHIVAAIPAAVAMPLVLVLAVLALWLSLRLFDG